MIRRYTSNQSQQSIKTVQHSTKISQITAKTSSKGTIKTAERSIKTAQQTSKATIKTSQTAAKTAAKSAQVSVRTAQRTAQAARAAANAATTVGKALVKAGVSAVKAIAAAAKELIAVIAAGGWIAVVIIVIIVLAACLMCSVFGIFASEKGYNGAPSMPEVVRQINADFSSKIDSIIQTNQHDKLVMNNAGSASMVMNWDEVLAVYAVIASTDPQSPMEVATLDDGKIGKLKNVFWYMNCITYSIEAVQVSTNEQNHEPITETVLTITVTYKSAGDMITYYGLDENRADQLRELLRPEYAELFKRLTGSFSDITLTSDEIADIMKTLPADLSEERKNVVLTAYSLLGKVNYFWGGKSLVLGWDSRWGTPMTVTADGSPSAGTIRPFGLDCSGFVDWVFYNETGGKYIIGHGGGAESQYSFCDDIPWDSAQPGDLVFYPDCEHVGIVVKNDSGSLTVIHCASGYDNVVITQREEGNGFAFVGRPRKYRE